MRKKELADYPARLRAIIADGYERGDSIRTIAKAAKVSTDQVRKVAALMRKAGALPEGPDRSREAAKTAPATEARIRRRDQKREELSTLLLERLSATAADQLLRRLEEEVELEPLVEAARTNLDAAVLALEALNAPDDAADPASEEEVKEKAEMRRAARTRVADARLVLTAYREGRIPARVLVGILTRAITDHLALEGQPETHPPAIVLEFGAPLPLETAPRIYDQAELASDTFAGDDRG